MTFHVHARPDRCIAARRRQPTVSEPAHVTILALADHHCRWVVGDAAGPATRYCGEPVGDQPPYCSTHRRVAYNAPDNRPSHMNRLAEIGR